MNWWKDVDRALESVPHAIVGAVAANAYMPARQTRDLDVAVATPDYARAIAAMGAAGWAKTGDLAVVSGASYSLGGHDVDLIQLKDDWGVDAIADAQANRRDGLPTMTLPYLTLMKLSASRLTDMGDLARMLGGADDPTLLAVRELVGRYGKPEDSEDLEQIIRLGKLEREG